MRANFCSRSSRARRTNSPGVSAALGFSGGGGGSNMSCANGAADRPFYARAARPRAASLAIPGLDVAIERFAGLLPHGALEHGRPAEQQAGHSQGLPRPAPERERVDVLADEALAEAESRVDAVLDL